MSFVKKCLMALFGGLFFMNSQYIVSAVNAKNDNLSKVIRCGVHHGTAHQYRGGDLHKLGIKVDKFKSNDYYIDTKDVEINIDLENMTAMVTVINHLLEGNNTFHEEYKIIAADGELIRIENSKDRGMRSYWINLVDDFAVYIDIDHARSITGANNAIGILECETIAR